MTDQIQPRKQGFWARQFQPQATINQLIFDIVLGIVAPILCFAFDPIAFRGGILGKPLFEEYQTLAYVFSGLEIMVLGMWLTFGRRLGFLNTVVGGVLVGGSVFCVVLGCILAPYSLWGLLVIIGILGFTPFITAFVYFRNGYRAVLSEGSLANQPLNAAEFLLGCMLAFGGPILLASGVDQVVSYSVEEIIHGDAQQASIAAKRVRPLSFLSGAKLDRIVNEYMNESNPARKERLRISYEQATGEDIEPKVAIILD